MDDHQKTPIDKMDEALSDIFNTEPCDLTSEQKKNAISIIEDIKDGNIDTDHQNARNSIYHLISQGNVALDYALELAKQSDSARGFEVVAGLLKTIADINTQLLDTHEKKEKVKKAQSNNGETDNGNVTNNNSIFVGSTAELSKMISDMNKEG